MGWMSGRLSGGLAAACIILAIDAVHAQTAAPSPQQRNASPSAALKMSGAGSGAPGGKTAAADPQPNLREAIAKMLEGNIGFRTLLDDGAPRLLDTKFAGPLQRRTDLFRSPETIYCVSAKLDIFPFPTQRVALLKVEPGQDGKPVLEATIGLNGKPFGCRLVKEYGPFPELDAARRKRRQAMRKTN